jgi:hypothetical protein
MRKKAAVIFCLLAAGCVSRQTLAPDHLLLDSSNLVHLSMNDGTILTFTPGNYSVRRISDTVLVVGSGIRTLKKGRSGTEPFEGSVNMTDIAELQVVDRYFPYALLYPAMVVSGAVVVWASMFFVSRL